MEAEKIPLFFWQCLRQKIIVLNYDDQIYSYIVLLISIVGDILNFREK